MIRILSIACAYGAAVFVAEITLGNASFPLHFWYFDRIPAWQWSVPVHAAGLLWIFLWARLLRGRPALLTTAVSWAFFATAETINRFRLALFEYSREPMGVDVSFTAVLALYGIFSTAIVITLRMWVFSKSKNRI